MKTCPKCHCHVDESAAFCKNCGHAFTISCSSCGAPLEMDSKFCSKCGAAIEAESAEGALSQITLLSADIKESTALISGVSAEKAHELLEDAIKVMSETITTYHGKILALTGDGLAASFEGSNNPLQACYAAAMMLQALLEMQLPYHIRVGIHSAETEGKETSDLMATTHFKTAQRIESNASEDGIQISYKVYDQYQGQIEVGNRINIKVPGQVLPLATYELRGLTPSAEDLIQQPTFEETSDEDEDLFKHEIEEQFDERKLITSCFIKVEARGEGAGKDEYQKIETIIKNCIIRFGGTLVKKAGNTFVSFYGAPISYEDHPLRACLTAYMFYQELLEKRLSWRFSIGIHTGEAVVGILGSKGYHQYDAIGSSVNLAARMMQTAAEDQIQITSATLHLVDKYIQSMPLGTKEVKGFGTPIETFALVGIQRDAIRKKLDAQMYANAPFVGREKEIEFFQISLEKLKEGEGTSIAFKAEPGIGKTRLMFECSRIAMDEGATIYSVSSSAYEKNESFSTLRLFVKSLFGINSPKLSSIEQSNVKVKLREFQFSDDLAHSAMIAILGGEVIDVKWHDLASVLQVKIIFNSLKELIIALSEKYPLILIFEDVQWCDEESMRFIPFLEKDLSNLSLILLLDYRSEFVLPDEIRGSVNERILLPLSEDDSRKLIGELLPGEKGIASVRKSILRWCHGNPYFMEEYVKNLIASHVVVKHNEEYVLEKDFETVNVPQTIESLIESRVDQLSKEDKTVLQQVSVLGKVFRYSFIRYINEDNENELRKSLNTLIDQGFIQEKQLFPEPEYTFKHAYLQDTVYQSILGKVKHKYHLKLINEIEEDKSEDLKSYYSILAHHSFFGELWTKALKYYNLQCPGGFTIDFPPHQYILLAQNAKTCFKNMNDNEKRSLFEDYGRIMMLYSHSLIVILSMDLGLENLNLLAEEAKRYASSLIQFYALAMKICASSMTGNAYQSYEQAKELFLLRDEALLGKNEKEIETIILDCNVASIHILLPLGYYEELDRHIEEALKTSLPLTNVSEYMGMSNVSVIYIFSSSCNIMRARFAYLKETLIPLEKKGLEGILPSEESIGLLHSMGVYYFGVGQFEKAQMYLDWSSKFCIEIRHPLMEALAGSYLVVILYYAGKKDEALKKAKDVFESQLRYNYSFSCLGSFFAAEILSLCGAYEEALEMVNDLIKIGEFDHQKPLLAACYRIKALTYNLMAHDDQYDDEILELLSKSKSITDEIGCNFHNPFIHLTYEQFYQRHGTHKEADQHHQRALEYFKEYGMTGWHEYYSQKTSTPST